MNINITRRAKAVVAAVKRDLYEVVSAFHINHVLHAVGATVALSVEEAKYHLLAGRIAPVAKAAPAPAPAVEDAAPVEAAPDHAADH